MSKAGERRPWPAPEKRFALNPNQGTPISDMEWRKLIVKWMVAIESFVEPVAGAKSNPGPLAQLLRSGKPFPLEMMDVFAELIDPKEAVFNGKLTIGMIRLFER